MGVPRRIWDIRLLQGFGGGDAEVAHVGVGEEEAQELSSIVRRELLPRKIRSRSLRGFVLAGRGCWLWFGR